MSDPEPVVDTQYGSLRGRVVSDSVMRFAGVPFARSPTGDRRFRPPEDPERWSGTRDATSFGPVCPQFRSPPETVGDSPSDEDCLCLNIWTPGTDGDDRPVLVWIHGGGYLSGAGNDPRIDGTKFAERGDIVLVTIQYRLGPLGGLYLRHFGDDRYRQSHNIQTLDQRRALRWIRANINDFGGDPQNLTMFGQSAGGSSVATLLVSSDADELVDKAVAQSGGLRRLRTPERAKEITEAFFTSAGLDRLDDLLSLSTDELQRATTKFFEEADEGRVTFFRPVRDGELVPKDPFEFVDSGGTEDIPLMHGTTVHESNWYTKDYMDESVPITTSKLKTRLQEHYSLSESDAEQMIQAVRNEYPSEDWQVCLDVLTQNRFREDHERLAEARVGAGESWQYLFGWESPYGLLRSAHTMEIPFVFHNLDGATEIEETVGENPPRGLADHLQDTWIAFARTGNPNQDDLPDWSVYDEETRRIMRFDLESTIVTDPESGIRKTWNAVGLPTYTTPISRSTLF